MPKTNFCLNKRKHMSMACANFQLLCMFLGVNLPPFKNSVKVMVLENKREYESNDVLKIEFYRVFARRLP